MLKRLTRFWFRLRRLRLFRQSAKLGFSDAHQTLMLAVLRLAAEGEQCIADVADSVANEFGLSAEEKETLLPSGRQRVLNNRIHWAKFYMSKAGLISSPAKGRFVATDEERKLLATKPDRSRSDQGCLRNHVDV